MTSIYWVNYTLAIFVKGKREIVGIRNPWQASQIVPLDYGPINYEPVN